MQAAMVCREEYVTERGTCMPSCATLRFIFKCSAMLLTVTLGLGICGWHVCHVVSAAKRPQALLGCRACWQRGVVCFVRASRTAM